MDIDDKLERVVRRHAELRDAMSRPDMAGDDFAKVSKEYASLTEMVEAVEHLVMHDLGLPKEQMKTEKWG